MYCGDHMSGMQALVGVNKPTLKRVGVSRRTPWWIVLGVHQRARGRSIESEECRYFVVVVVVVVVDICREA
jgi:hypothetical protein